MQTEIISVLKVYKSGMGGGGRDTYSWAGGSSRAGFSIFAGQTLRRGRRRSRKEEGRGDRGGRTNR